MSLSIDEALGRFGLTQFRPGQREIIEAVLAGRPTIAVLPTGAGKSLCYQLPAVALERLAVVVSPLISLMKDQVDALTARGIPATFINSSIPPDERAERLRAAVRGELRLLYVAPERFRAPGFAETLARARAGAARGRRGALHGRVGARLPARLRAPRRGARAARSRRGWSR